MAAPEPRAWQGIVYRHIPADSPFGPLVTFQSARSRENRWNQAGEPTLAFAGAVNLLAEAFQRHIDRNRDPSLAAHYQPRRIVQVELRLRSVFDLTNATTVDALGIRDAPDCFADRAAARATAGFLRHARNADGLIVPCQVSPGDPAGWLLLVFLDRLSEPLDAAVLRVKALDTFQPSG